MTSSWRHEELERLERLYDFYKNTEIMDPCTGDLRSKSLKYIIDYHRRFLNLPDLKI